ncbi:hypothetical protein FRC03_003384 [Tulasnella sp. 419]|nr:hypothetical protein FRC03_003384 [Tulasnella sp. 419]
MFWQAENVQIEYFQPAMKLLRDCGIIYPSNDDRLLIHAFSNGGCVKLTTLAKAIRRHDPFALKQSSALQARAVIMDSCPGKIGLFRGIRAFSAAIRNRLLRYLAKCIIGSILIFAVAYYRITRLPDLFEVMQRDLLDPTLLPFTSHRAYIYSNNDALIAVPVVEAHAQVARNKGIPVRLEKYERTTHVGHMRANSVRYWDIVRDTWEDGKYGKSLEWPDKGPKDLQSPKVRAPL